MGKAYDWVYGWIHALAYEHSVLKYALEYVHIVAKVCPANLDKSSMLLRNARQMIKNMVVCLVLSGQRVKMVRLLPTRPRHRHTIPPRNTTTNLKVRQTVTRDTGCSITAVVAFMLVFGSIVQSRFLQHKWYFNYFFISVCLVTCVSVIV